MSPTAALGLSLWLALPAAAAPASEPDDAARLESDLRRRMRDIVPLLERLETLRLGYARLEDPAAVAPERTEVRRRLTEAQTGFTEDAAEFEEVRKRFQVLGLQRVLSSRGADGTDVARGWALESFSGEVKDLRKKVKVMLHYEDLDYAAAVDKRAAERRQARQMWAGGAALLLLLGAAGAAAWAWRGREPAPTLRLGPPSGPGGAVPPGTLVGGNYRVVREIGRGGMGLVYEAFDESLRRRVAVKQMRAEFRDSPRDLEAFLAEARLVAALKHPNVVDIHAIVNDGAEVFLVFEFVEGETLHRTLQRTPRLALPPALSVAREVGLALDCAHAQKIIHRDLKPANVMVLPNGGIKVMDFGLAHQAHISVARQTRAESWGTPPYMAPEQELGTVSRESDLFSLGVVLYEMLTGRLPFVGPNYLAQKREMRFAPPSQASPGIPATLDAVMARALHAEPERRFHSAADLVAAVGAVRA